MLSGKEILAISVKEVEEIKEEIKEIEAVVYKKVNKPMNFLEENIYPKSSCKYYKSI